jgi:hypothetical protein
MKTKTTLLACHLVWAWIIELDSGNPRDSPACPFVENHFPRHYCCMLARDKSFPIYCARKTEEAWTIVETRPSFGGDVKAIVSQMKCLVENSGCYWRLTFYRWVNRWNFGEARNVFATEKPVFITSPTHTPLPLDIIRNRPPPSMWRERNSNFHFSPILQINSAVI